MGIVEDFLKFKSSSEEELAASVSSGIVEQYLKSQDKPKRVIIDVTPKPPISGASKAQSDEINAEPSQKGDVNPRSQERLLDRAGSAVVSAASSGVSTAGEGLGETFSGKPASGLGKVGMGALSVLSSPLAGAGQIAGDITGNKDFANKVELATGGVVPIVPGAAAISKVRPKNRALSDLVEMITSEGRNPENLVHTIREMKANPLIGPIDTSPAVLSANQKLYVTEGAAAKNYLHNTSKDRMGKLSNTVNEAFDEAAGLPVNAVQKLKDLSTASRKVGDEAINPAIKSAGAVDLTPAIAHIDRVLKPGVNSVITQDSTLLGPKVKQELTYAKKYLANESEMRTGAEELNRIQSSFRTKADAMMRSPVAEEKQAGQALMEVRNKIVDAIDKASGGKYKPALSSYRDEKHIAEAFHDAYNGVISGSKKLENRPEFTKEWFDGLTNYEKEAAKEGVRLRIDSEIGAAQNGTLAGTNLGKSAFNRSKMEILFGKEETDKLLQKLDHVKSIKRTDAKLTEGSDTASRISADKAVDLPVKGESKGLSKYVVPAVTAASEIGGVAAGLPTGIGGTLGLVASLGGAAISKGASATSHAISVKLAKERNLQLAKKSLPTEGPDRDQLIRDLEAHLPGPKQSLLTRGLSKANSLSRIIGP